MWYDWDSIIEKKRTKNTVSWKDEWKNLLFSVPSIVYMTAFHIAQAIVTIMGQKNWSRQSNFSARVFDKLHQYTDDNIQSPPTWIYKKM